MRRTVSLLVAACCGAVAQDANKLRDALEWTIAQRGRFSRMLNPVVRAHATASLGALVCAEDQVQGSGLFREAITGLHSVPDNAFRDKGTTVLPAASFTGLWKYIVPAALKCDPALSTVAVNARTKERIDAERVGANATLRRAWELIDGALDKQDNNDRAAQLATGALDAGEPDVLDLELLTLFLARLRDRAPDLSDDLFERSLDFVMSEDPPDPAGLQELAKYLFTSPRKVDKDDRDLPGDNFQAGGATIEVLTAARASTNPDEIEALIDALLRLLKIPVAAARNYPVAYALALQLEPRARDLMPDRLQELQDAIAALEAQITVAAQIRGGAGPAENPDQASGDPAQRDYWLAGQIKTALSGGSVDRARQLVANIDNSGVRGQLAELIRFTEAARAAEVHSEMTMPLANVLRAGIKRCLVYIAVIANAAQPDAALQVLPLAVHDIEPLPAEQRIRLFAALVAAVAKTDAQAAVGTLDLLIKAYNDVYSNPRRGRFEPRAASRIFNKDTSVDTSTDSSLILAGTRGLYEAVQTQRGRRNFPLKLPGVTALNLANFVMSAAKIDPGLLEAAILGLRDENTRAGGLVRLGALRIRTAKTGK